MFICGVGTATPKRQYKQWECWEALAGAPQFTKLNPRSQGLLQKVLQGQNGIDSRYLALDPLEEAFELDPDTLHRRFASHAPALAVAAARQALSQAARQTDEVDAVLVSTCTGYLCPGLTSYVSEQLGLRQDLYALDLVGHGCGAALPNLRTAELLLRGGGCEVVLSICVEICSAAFYLDDDPGVLISACLFGDGAAAVVAERTAPAHRRRVAWKAGHSLMIPADRDYLRFEQRGGMLRNILTPQVPALAAKSAEASLVELLNATRVSREDLRGWILHAGGREVLLALRRRVGLSAEDVRWTSQILWRHGNLSSPSVLFALKAALEGAAPGGIWWMSAFGAGFSCHSALLEVE